MPLLASAHPSARGVEEDILIPLLARLTTVCTALDAAAAAAAPPPIVSPEHPISSQPSAGTDATAAALEATTSHARALLEKIKGDMAALRRLFRRIDRTEKGIRYSFDPVEQHMDNAIQQQERPSVEHIHSQLLAVDAEIEAIRTKICAAYNLPLSDRDAGEDHDPPRPEATGVAMTRRMEELRYGPQMRHLKLAVSGLDARVRGSLLCLAAFPEGAVVKKRLLIHWWIGEGFVKSADAGKRRFDQLVAKGFIIPVRSALCGTVSRCTVRPWVLDLLMSLARTTSFLELDCSDFALARRVCLTGGKVLSRFSADARAIYNIDHKYVELDKGWFAGKKELCTLQLGQWRELGPREQIANPMASHIEVSGVERFADIQSCKSLRYISFRGISRIESLPDSIGNLRELVVLDLRACHNLEELGQGITKLDRLEYLDLSECHLLGGMPKGLGRLTRLQVLKGFVVANTNSKDPCHLNELTKLDKLRKLGIVIGKMAVPTDDEFLKLAEFAVLESLTIRWGLLASEKSRNEEGPAPHPVVMMKFALPPNLKKLDLHCFPLAEFPQWVPKGVKKLYIRGGKLATLSDEEGWDVEVLRLRFLRDLQYNHDTLQRCFKKLDPDHTEYTHVQTSWANNDVYHVCTFLETLVQYMLFRTSWMAYFIGGLIVRCCY
ncbi:disease resistance RPP13-like protein 4 isoform X3 [Brachypodium distachyon]|uniref:Rx N-terminal domain-containing protein n=1 Tax=Brachypodium distachyon TaxID=15368 RepID=A0A0Q3HGK3_BRADI|nr:disease resistance RPP13-like protein 4 isoform X3 [Brachypodium distachyon]KQJ87563.1 hypothetical protein BRADI_4g11930v3 [Brachypodium distachyon]|eukprot:XP_014758248.1 disease resistance RPP13-like protein 4 isoform X3 [Brachypodium distachyon]